MKDLQLFSIMPLNVRYMDEICEDIKEQYESGVATCALFSMTLVPEGNPPVDKATEFCAKYDLFKEKLDALGLKSGILVQATIGHSRPLNEESPFQKYVSLKTGETTPVCCPADEGFCDHMRQVFATLASHQPAVIMVDDDFRLLDRPWKGCVCPIHMAAFNELAGTDWTDRELFAHLSEDKEGEIAKWYVETQRAALLKAARAMREGIDRVNPSLPGMFCGVGNHIEFAEEVAQILAGEGNPVILRINNGNYTPAGARYLSKVSYRSAVQMEHIREKVDVILAETDTCPQNRYSTGAQSLHAHFVASILEGAKGAKHWITRLAAYEPDSGKAYRKVLSRYRGMYDALAQLEPQLEWLGCRIPLTVRRNFCFEQGDWGMWDGADGFSSHVLERMGLPLYFSSKEGGAVFLSGQADKKFTGEEILQFLKGPVFLSSEVAWRLQERGFGEYIGVEVKEWSGKKPSCERFEFHGKSCSPQVKIKQLVPLYEEVRADSMVLHTVDNKNYEPLFPGTTVYQNKLGGTVVVFCGTPITEFNFMQAFSFLNESRKQQLIRLLRECGKLPVYYTSDEEVYLRAARMQDGSMFCCIFNIGMDPIEEIALTVEQAPFGVEYLTNDGSRKSCAFRIQDNQLVAQIPAYTLQPVALILKY